MVVVVGFGGAGDVQIQLSQFHLQGLTGNAQRAGGLVPVTTSVFKDSGEEEAVHMSMHVRVEIGGVSRRAREGRPEKR